MKHFTHTHDRENSLRKHRKSSVQKIEASQTLRKTDLKLILHVANRFRVLWEVYAMRKDFLPVDSHDNDLEYICTHYEKATSRSFQPHTE